MIFNAEQVTKSLVRWLSQCFEENGKDCKAVVGISGGKDSTVVAALCVKALGKDRVVGVLMPNGIQRDIEDSKAVCRHLGIDNFLINIKIFCLCNFNKFIILLTALLFKPTFLDKSTFKMIKRIWL